MKNELIKFLKSGKTLTALAVITGCALLAVLLKAGASAEFTLVILGLFALCCLVFADVHVRRRWEENVTDRINAVQEQNERLSREIARNRNNVATFKNGLGNLVASVQKEGRNHGPATSIEARLIETIVRHLGALGNQMQEKYERERDMAGVMELDMLPPPQNQDESESPDKRPALPLPKFDEQKIASMVREAVTEDNIALFIQPVVSLPQRKPRMYEVYARIQAGQGAWLPAQTYMGEARKAHLVPAIDNLLLLRCLQSLRNTPEKTAGRPYILNIAANSLHDASFMNDLVGFLSENRNMAERLVFELPQEDVDALDGSLKAVLDGLSKLGCRFSMDRVHKREIDILRLKNLHIRFIKLDARWLMREGKTKGGFSKVMELKRRLDQAGIDLIVEKIENEDLLRELLDYNIDYGQGYLFGKPDLPVAWKETQDAA